ncbi:MAG: VCBS repeat-containing protein, partial [Planctomycetes bacterium]|nr:VCBS repeat-containing protein [Planctomycetota bacterium]
TFADQTTALLPNWTSRCFDLLPGDFDNDGDTDVVASDWTAEWILVNTGGGRLILSPSTLPGTLSTLEHEASDVDGDGDLDILAITNIGVKLLENVGGAFVDRTSTHLPPQTADALAIELGDVDGDGDLDLAVTPNAITTYAALLWTNLGNGVFVDASSQLPPAPRTSRPA